MKPYNLFYSNGVAILSGFYDILQNISVGFTDVIARLFLSDFHDIPQYQAC